MEGGGVLGVPSTVGGAGVTGVATGVETDAGGGAGVTGVATGVETDAGGGAGVTGVATGVVTDACGGFSFVAPTGVPTAGGAFCVVPPAPVPGVVTITCFSFVPAVPGVVLTVALSLVLPDGVVGLLGRVDDEAAMFDSEEFCPDAIGCWTPAAGTTVSLSPFGKSAVPWMRASMTCVDFAKSAETGWLLAGECSGVVGLAALLPVMFEANFLRGRSPSSSLREHALSVKYETKNN